MSEKTKRAIIGYTLAGAALGAFAGIIIFVSHIAF